MKTFDFVIDGPANFFGAGRSSLGCYTREGFDGMVKAYRALGKTVHVYENHYPVFAVIEPLKRVQPATAFDMSRLPSASESMKNPTGSPFFSREHGCYVKVVA